MEDKEFPGEITNEEKWLLSIFRINKMNQIMSIDKSIYIGNWRFRFEWHSKKNLWGRFGGGWDWKLGIQWGKTHYIFSFFIFTLSICLKAKK